LHWSLVLYQILNIKLKNPIKNKTLSLQNQGKVLRCKSTISMKTKFDEFGYSWWQTPENIFTSGKEYVAHSRVFCKSARKDGKSNSKTGRENEYRLHREDI
jgi:hypothetical protein